MRYVSFSKNSATLQDESRAAASIAQDLHNYVSSDLVRDAIRECHQLNASSQQIQAVLHEKLQDLGFHGEKKGLFSEYPVASLRPDFYRPVGHSGIILEIERGKTITNNMDLLDLWKCHLCAHAEFLFLVVPNERASQNGQVIRAFDSAARRLSTFFKPPNYVNVEAVHIFGY